ncbi:DUF397 domain-containing protein [Streptomyces sp. DG2A-72]|uniref:DUF397 domain-containing protein n=1 Tax=Streptomyces sp. DG2A-72 TaxID=3051386 RepID=UPI00265C72D1|nr:DUF397 domain-containing protein [Streptomyces sp. DG2A-72]MDO0935956.1 DUF397 domain-containing protein [Streptomyces sp. DG2A-72]
MRELHWQKSTYSQEASACVHLAATPTGTILLHESDEPETILTTGPRQLADLISALRHWRGPTIKQPERLSGPHSTTGTQTP